MSLRRLIALALFGGLVLAAPGALAQDQEDPEPEVSDVGPEPTDPYDRFLAIQVTGGLDTPFGVGGGAIEFTPFRHLMIYAGGGASRSGGRVAGGVAFQYPIHSTSVGVFAGLGGGSLNWDSRGSNGETQIQRWWEFALFFHSGIHVEYRWQEGIFGRLGLGIDALVYGDPDECTLPAGGECGGEAASLAKPIRGWVGLTIGYAFDL